MTRMTRPDCAVMCNLINTHTHTLLQVRPEEAPPEQQQKDERSSCPGLRRTGQAPEAACAPLPPPSEQSPGHPRALLRLTTKKNVLGGRGAEGTDTFNSSICPRIVAQRLGDAQKV